MNCKFCVPNPPLLIKEYAHWRLSLAESQLLLGWTHASLKRHVLQFEDLRDEELIELRLVIQEIKGVLRKSFNPDWFNVMQMGNMTPHLHFQLVPRYKESRVFAGREFVDKTYGRPAADEWVVEDDGFLQELLQHIQKELKG